MRATSVQQIRVQRHIHAARCEQVPVVTLGQRARATAALASAADGQAFTARTNRPGPQESGRWPTRVTSPVRQPHESASARHVCPPPQDRQSPRRRTLPVPRPKPSARRRAPLASLSAPCQQGPSTVNSCRPRQSAPGVASVAIGLATLANSTRNDSDPSRSLTLKSEDFAGTCASPSSPAPRRPSTRPHHYQMGAHGAAWCGSSA